MEQTGPSFLGASGEVARQAALVDWAATPLGPPDGWSTELRGIVQVLLSSRFSMWMAWGPQLTMLYNDAYRRDTLRAKHPWALGRPAREVWAEVWADVESRIESVLRGRGATWDEELLLFLERSGYPEETYHTFSYSPLFEAGQVRGLLCVVTENTDRVLSERRMATLRELAAALAEARTEAALLAAVGGQLAGNPRDLPFALVHLVDEAEGPVRLAAAAGIEPGDPAAAPDAAGWPVDRARRGEEVLVTDLAERFGRLPAGAWTAPPSRAVVLPLTGSRAGARVRGFLVVGLSPVRPYDERYRGFVRLLAGQIGSALVNARAYEAERRRAAALADLDRAKTEFFANVSHEFRTPLALIAGPVRELVAAAESGGLDPVRVRTELAAVDRNVGRLGRLVDNLLDFSRVQAGRAQARYEPTDLASVTADLASMFRTAVERAGLGYAVDTADLGEPVWVDLSMWEKVVLNLLSNAVKYTLRGSVAVRVRRDAGAAVFEIADTGVGIPAAELPRLFDRFHRVPDAGGRSVEGSGIGLALVRELVELHGGRVEVASEPGAGTTFTVRLPFGSAHLPAEQVADRAPGPAGYEAAAARAAVPYVTEALSWLPPAEAAGTPVLDGPVAPSVLVADDNADMRGYLARLLGPHYRVELVADGVAALESARERRPDVLLTDVMMPGLDGFGLLAALRADPQTRTLPVIVLSARAGQEAAVGALAAGADDYLVKPFSAGELLARVRSVLSLARLRRREAAWRGALLDALQDGLFVVNDVGQVVEVNDGFAGIVGYGPEGLPYDLPHPWWPDPETDPADYARLVEAMAAVRTAGRGRHLLALRHRDGHRVWVEMSVDTVADPDRPEPPMLIGLARDVTAAQRAARRDRLLVEAGQRLMGSAEPGGDLVDRLQRVVELAAPVYDDLVAVLRARPDGRLPVVAAAHPQRPELAAAMLALEPYRIPVSLAERYRHGRAFVLDPTPPELLREALGDGASYAARVRIGLGASLLAPLVVAGHVLGLLVVICPGDGQHRPGEPTGRFDRADVELAEELARRIAVALEAERVATREHQLNAASSALAAAATVGEAAAALADAVRDALNASGIAVHVPSADNPTRLELVHVEGLSPELAEGYAEVSLTARMGVAEAARTGHPVWIGDRQLYLARFPDSPVARGSHAVQAMAVLPWRLADRVAGIVSIAFTTPRAFPEAERKFATTLVGQAAQAFARASLTDTRWDIALTLQDALLPAVPPAIDRLAVATRYLPAVYDVAAGGDWYEIIPLDQHRTAIVVGDVVGQGATAAAVMGQLRSALAFALTTQGAHADPAAALAQLNRFVFRVPDARGTTAVCVVLDLQAGLVRWACAGHPPPLLVRGAGAVHQLDEVVGPLLGALRPGPGASGDGPGDVPSADVAAGDVAAGGVAAGDAAAGGVAAGDVAALYRTATAELAAGDTVVLYTDGLIERRGEVLDDGLGRLAAAAREAAGEAPAALVNRLLAAALPDGRGNDDVAVVAARVLPAPLRRHRPADPRELAGMRRATAEWAAAAALDPALVDDLQLALGEAAANAVEHAYPGGAAGTFEYSLGCAADADRTRVRVTVTDHGSWRPAPADRGYRGRGLQLITALGTDVTVEHPDGGAGTVVGFTMTGRPADPGRGARPRRPDPAPARAAEPGSLEVLDHPGEPGRRRLVLRGEIDLTTVRAVRERLLAELAPGGRPDLDLREVTYLSSAGVGLLLEVLERAGGGLPVALPRSGPVARVLAVTGLHRMLPAADQQPAR